MLSALTILCVIVQGLSDAAFQAIMHTLLGYVKRDKFVDHLSARLAARLGTVAEVHFSIDTTNVSPMW